MGTSSNSYPPISSPQLNTDINLQILSIEHARQIKSESAKSMFANHDFSPILNELAIQIAREAPDERNQSILFDRIGLGTSPQTLESIAKRHLLTRERVRQIVDKRLSRATKTFTSLTHQSIENEIPLLHATMLLLYVNRDVFDNDFERSLDDYRNRQLHLAASQFADLGLLTSPDEVRALAQWALILLDLPIDNTMCPPNALSGSWWVELIWPDSLDEPAFAAHQQNLREYFTFISQTFQKKHQRLPNAAKAAMHRLQTRGWIENHDVNLRNDVSNALDVKKIDHVHYGSWIIRTDESRNSFRDAIGRALTVLGGLSTRDLVEALANAKPGRSVYSIHISESDLEDIFNMVTWTEFYDGKWHWKHGMVEVGNVDVQIHAALKRLPPVFFWAEALNAVHGFSSVAALSFFLKGPYGVSLRRNMYCIRGTRYNALDLARKLPVGLKGQVSASARLVSHDPDVFHVDLPMNWNSQVHLGRFYENHWTVRCDAFTGIAKVNGLGVLVSGLAPLIKKGDRGGSVDLLINSGEREIEVLACDLLDH